MGELRKRLRELLPDSIRERYHRYALRRDFGIDRENGTRRPVMLDPRRPAGLNVVGYFESSSGVGQSARSLADANAPPGPWPTRRSRPPFPSRVWKSRRPRKEAGSPRRMTSTSTTSTRTAPR